MKPLQTIGIIAMVLFLQGTGFAACYFMLQKSYQYVPILPDTELLDDQRNPL